MSASPLAFAPQLRAHVISEDEVLLLSERERFALGGRVHVALAPLLDGSRTADELAVELAGEHSAALVYFALARLQRRGHVVEAGGSGDEPRGGRTAAPPLAGWLEASVAVEATALRDVVSLGVEPSWGRMLTEALPASVGGEGPSLTVCLLDDYLRPELEAIAAAVPARGELLLPVRAAGRWLWFGPLLRGSASLATWRLFRERMWMNRSLDLVALERGAELPLFGADRSPANAELAISIAAALAERILGGAAPSAVIDAMLAYDTVEQRFERHPIALIAAPRDRRTPEFGERIAPIELRCAPVRFGDDAGHRTRPPAETLARLEQFVSPITGIVSSVEQLPAIGGMHVFAAVHIQAPAAARAEGGALGRKGAANGKGASEEQARASCLGEAVERYSGGFFGDEPRRTARLDEIGALALSPEELLLYSDAQYAARRDPGEVHPAEAVPARLDRSQAIEWVPVSSLISGATRWLPAAYCYYGYAASGAGGYRGEPYCVADSNGCAAGNTLEEAILQGMMELVERDACGLAWYSRARRAEIVLDGFPGRPFAPVCTDFASRGRVLHVLDLRADTQIPVALAVAWNRGDGGDTRFALGCHLDPRIAVSRALSELAQLEQLDAHDAPGAESFASPWIGEQPNLIPSDAPPVAPAELPNFSKDDIAEELHWCCGMLAELGHDVLVLDQTRPEIGVPTARVVVPGLRHFWRRLAPGRLYDIPVALGWVERRLLEEELNPHSVLI